jgi:hypothetical protein
MGKINKKPLHSFRITDKKVKLCTSFGCAIEETGYKNYVWIIMNVDVLIGFDKRLKKLEKD